MQPWGTVTGRLLVRDENGKPISENVSMGDGSNATNADTDVGDLPPVNLDMEGRFRIERLVPGLRYSAKVYRGTLVAGMAFENLLLRPGEIRDLGDILIKPPLLAKSGTKSGN